MFRLSEDYEYDWRVRVRLPEDGQHKTHQFTARFKALPQSRIDALLKAKRGGDGDEDTDDADILREVLCGWQDVQDADGGALDFCDDARDKLLDMVPVRIALAEAFWDSILGRKIRQKN